MSRRMNNVITFAQSVASVMADRSESGTARPRRLRRGVVNSGESVAAFVSRVRSMTQSISVRPHPPATVAQSVCANTESASA